MGARRLRLSASLVRTGIPDVPMDASDAGGPIWRAVAWAFTRAGWTITFLKARSQHRGEVNLSDHPLIIFE